MLHLVFLIFGQKHKVMEQNTNLEYYKLIYITLCKYTQIL